MNITIPKVKRVYPPLMANNIVSVQPLLQPTGLIYYLRYRYAEHKKHRLQNVFVDPVPDLIPPKRRSIDDPWGGV